MKAIRIVGWLAFLAGSSSPERREAAARRNGDELPPVAVKDPPGPSRSGWRPRSRGSCAARLALLGERYDLADRPAPGVTMSRGKPVQEGVRVEAARRA